MAIPKPYKPTKKEFIDMKFGPWDFNEIKSIVESEFGPDSFDIKYLYFQVQTNTPHTITSLSKENLKILKLDDFVYPHFSFKIFIPIPDQRSNDFKKSPVKWGSSLMNSDLIFSNIEKVKKFLDDNFKDDFYIFLGENSTLFNSNNINTAFHINIVMKDGISLGDYIDLEDKDLEDSRTSKGVIKKFMDFMDQQTNFPLEQEGY
jgi:hypothetical protein